MGFPILFNGLFRVPYIEKTIQKEIIGIVSHWFSLLAVLGVSYAFSKAFLGGPALKQKGKDKEIIGLVSQILIGFCLRLS